MREDTNIRQKLATQLRDLPAEQVKQAMLQWLDRDDGSLEDLEQSLDLERLVVYGTIKNDNAFVPLTEEEMIAQSLEALEDYQQSVGRISSETMEDWANSLGTDRQYPCPQ